MCSIPNRLRNNNIKSIKSPNRLFPFPIISFLFLKNKIINNYLPNVFSIPFVIYQYWDLYLYSIYPTLFFRNQFVMLKLSPLINLLLFVLESFLNSHFLVLFFILILLFFVEYCLRMLVFYVILVFRISIHLCTCRFIFLHCLFLLLFVIYEKCFETLSFKYLFHVLV